MHPKTAARQAALRTLVAIDEGRILGLGLDAAPSETRGFGREILSGSLRWRARLDWTLAPLLKQPLGKLDPPVRAALRLALYERLYLSTPLSALANEYAGLMKLEKLASATGFVNAVARRLPETARPSPPEKDLAAHLGVEFSHPVWLVQRYLDRLGPGETRELMAANNLQAGLTLRVNTLRTTREEVLATLCREGITASPGGISPDAVRIDGSADPTRWEIWHAGEVIAQDEAAQMVARLAAPAPGATVIDVASAPGGKTTHLAQIMNNQGRIFACDLAPGRLKLVEENARRLGIEVITTVHADGLQIGNTVAQELDGKRPDLVLLDAPCTGTGTLRRRPDARWRRQPRDLAELSKLQYRLLEAAAEVLPHGGVLVYSTCSLEPEENEDQLEAWLSAHPEWKLDPASPRDFGAAATQQGYLAMAPYRHHTDGMFAARLVRVN